MASSGNNKRVTISLIAVLLVVLTFSVTTFAWYTLSENNKSNIHIQTFDTYSVNLSDIAVDPVLSYGGSVAKDDLQSNGESVVYQAQNASGTQYKYNTIDGRIAYVVAKIPMTITNFSGESQTWSIKIDGFDVYGSDGIVISDTTSGTASVLATRIKSDIMLQFIDFDEVSNTITGIHYASDTDTAPASDSWKYVNDGISRDITISGNGDQSVYVAVAFAVSDDAIDEAYLGMSIKIKASASKK